MTRTEAKARLVAWRVSARQMHAISRRIAILRRRKEEAATIRSSLAFEEVAVTENGPELAALPHGTTTGDPTARAAIKCIEIQDEMDELQRQLDQYSRYYFDVLKATVEQLPYQDFMVLHSYYCIADSSAMPGVDSKSFFRKLRDATTMFQTVFGLPQIPKMIEAIKK